MFGKILEAINPSRKLRRYQFWYTTQENLPMYAAAIVADYCFKKKVEPWHFDANNATDLLGMLHADTPKVLLALSQEEHQKEGTALVDWLERRGADEDGAGKVCKEIMQAKARAKLGPGASQNDIFAETMRQYMESA